MDNPFDEIIKRLERIELLIGSNDTSPTAPEVKSKPVTTKELCEFLAITEPTVIRWRRKGKIPFFTIGSAIRFDLDKVLKALEKK